MSQGCSLKQNKRIYIELNDHENIIYQYLWDTAKKIVLRGEFIA